MLQHFIACDRDQDLLLPPNLRDWLPEDRFARFVRDAVEAMDLSAFYAAYRQDGHGRACAAPPNQPGQFPWAGVCAHRTCACVE
jgi:transposase